MNPFPLLDELRTIAENGLHYADDPYDEERYERLLELASEYYGEALDRPPESVRERFAAELGHVTPKVGGRIEPSRERIDIEYRDPDSVTDWHKDHRDSVTDAREVWTRRRE